MRLKLTLSLVAILVMIAVVACAQVIVLDEPLQSSTTGTLVGGSFTGSAYRIDAKQDAIYWHLPHVVRNGYAQMTVTGMDGLPGGYSKYEIFHAYNSVADTAGYDALDYKMYFRKENTDKIRSCLALPGIFNDTVSSVNPGWAGTHVLKFQWASTTGSLTINAYWDGVLQETKTITSAGQIWDPPVMSIRIGASSRGSTTGAIIGATYSNLQVWDNDMIPPTDDSQSASDTIPTGMIAGQSYGVSVTMRNIGSGAWTAAGGYQLGAVGGSDPFCAFNSVSLTGGDSIPQNQQKTFNFTMTAPATAGTYTTDWQMVHNAIGFGATLTKQVQVTYADSAQFISDTIPATMTGGLQYDVSVTMKNTSQNTWTQALSYKLGANDDSDPFGPGRVDLGASDSIAPNQQKTFAFAMTAPAIPGTYTTDWRMVHEGVCWFGDIDTKQVVVSAPAHEVGVVLDDSLQGSTNGTQPYGGHFVAGGWTPDDQYDAIFWHLPRTISHGKVDFYVKGLNQNECRTSPWDMTQGEELFHMYDYMWSNSDYSYGPGYRDNPYKMFLRKCGCGYSYNGNMNNTKVVYTVQSNGFEEYGQQILSWDPNTNYHFTIQWGPDDKGNTIITCYRDGVQFFQKGFVGIYSPAGHAIRIGASPRRSNEGVPQGAIFSYLKITDLSETVVPTAPAVIQPGNTLSTTSRTPLIRWHGDPHTAYQVRINTSNDPGIGTIWDSGQVISTASQVTCGVALADQTVYYPFVKIGTETGWSAWSPAGFWFKVGTTYVPVRRGPVAVSGSCFQDTSGKYLALGFTHMRAVNRCKYDRDRYMNDLCDMASKGFNYQRILSCVSWDGLEIVPIDYVSSATGQTVYAWPDYDQQLKDTIDIAYDIYGIRTEICIFAASDIFPTSAGQYAQMDRILADVVGRENKIHGIEVANEYYANGPGDIPLIRTYGSYLAARTSIPIALSSPASSDMCSMYCNSDGDYATYHASRDTSNYGWTMVSDIWDVAGMYPSIPPVSSDEPVGPGSSVAEEWDPCRLASAAVVCWIAHAPAYTYHGRFGVTGLDKTDGHDVKMSSTPGFGAYQYVLNLLPNDLSCWTRNDGKETAAPFTAYCKGLANTYWTDTSGAGDGCYRNYGTVSGTGANGDQFVCYPMGIMSGGLTLRARKTLTFTVYNPLTGAVVMGPVKKNTDETISLAGIAGTNIAYLIKGYIGDGPSCMASVTSFNVTSNGTTNNLSWTNPSDVRFVGTMIRFRADSYPTSINDGTLACYKTGASGANDSFAHTGVNQCGYYAAWGYDGVSLTSCTPAFVTTCVVPDWQIMTFDDYANGNLGGQGGWATVGTCSAQVQSSVTKGGAGKAIALEPCLCAGSIANQISFVTKSSGTFLVSFDVAQDAAGTVGQLMGYLNVYGSNSATEITKIQFQKGRMFADYGSGALATLSASVANLVWNNVKLAINVDSKTMDFYYNGTSLGTGYAWKGTATDVCKLIIASECNSSLTTQKLYIDNVRVEPRPGQVASVTDDGAWTPSLSKLHFSFPAVTGTPEYQYAIGTTSGGTQTRGWTSCGTSTDVVATGLSLTENTTSYYISVQCLNQYGGAGLSRTSNGIKVGVGLSRIKDAKALADGTTSIVKALRGRLVSAVFPGYFYIQEPDGPFGIKVVSGATVSPGDSVDVCGIMKGAGAERYLDGTGDGVIKTAGPGGPHPIVLGHAGIGGVALNSYSPGVVGGRGPHSIGAYSVAFGKVTQRQTTAPMYFYIDDGNGLKDSTTTGGVNNVGVRVVGDPTNYPAGSYVAVTGIVSCFDASGLRPAMLPQTIQLLKAP